MSASIKTLLVLPANSLLTFSSSLLSYLMEPLSFFFSFAPPLFLHREREERPTVQLEWVIIYWLGTHTHTQWKQIG